MKTAIVTTTINVPTFLTAYADNAKHYGHSVKFIVVGDMKTADGAGEFCRSIPNCTYMHPLDQTSFLMSNGLVELQEHLPWNTIARRTVGHLLAYKEGAEVIIMLDDDNLATSHDVVSSHSCVGKTVETEVISSRSGWYNICDHLKEENNVRFYARGYPPSKRWKDGSSTSYTDKVKIAVNAGLWINDPDIDAITRLERRLITTDFKEGKDFSYALGLGTWSPWNCQNTAISRDALESYFLSPYTGRHLDIWASYITTRVAEHLGESVAFGYPLAFHERSPHNLYKDLKEEVPWIEMTDEFVEALRTSRITGKTYNEAFMSAVVGLEDNWRTQNPVKNQYLQGLRAWRDTFKRLRGAV